MHGLSFLILFRPRT